MNLNRISKFCKKKFEPILSSHFELETSSNSKIHPIKLLKPYFITIIIKKYFSTQTIINPIKKTKMKKIRKIKN